MNMKSLALVNLILAIFVIVGLLMSHLALTDIAHNIEPDLTAEWWVLRFTFMLVVGLVFISLYTARTILRRIEERRPEIL